MNPNTNLPRTLEPHDLLAVLQNYFLLVILAFAPLEPNEEERANTKGEGIPSCGRAIPRINQATCITESAVCIFKGCCVEYGRGLVVAVPRGVHLCTAYARFSVVRKG